MSDKRPRISKDEAHEALKVYLKEQVEFEAISLMQTLVEHIMAHAGELDNPQYSIQLGSIPVDYLYGKALSSARDLDLGRMDPPVWMERFLDLIKQIREEFDLPENSEDHHVPFSSCP